MNPLNLDGELQIQPPAGGDVVVRIPVSMSPGPWLRRFLPLAQSKQIPAEVEEVPDGVFLVVRVPPGATREETFQLLDTASDLIGHATAEESRQLDAFLVVDRHAREWWEAQRR